MIVTKFAVFAVVLSVTTAALGAGGHGGGHGHAEIVGEPGQAADVGRTVTVTMYDNYYEPSSIAVTAGETVRFVVNNQGQLVHEFNLGTAAMHEAHQAEMLAMVEHGVLQGTKINHDMMAMDMGNGQTMQHDDPNSVLLEPGQSGEILWRFSAQGAIEFACNVPGHYQAGMVGGVTIN